MTDRSDYTWEAAQQDLALLTRLTIVEACDLIRPLRATGINPYDVLPLLQQLVDPNSTPAVHGGLLHSLLTLPREDVA